VTVEAFDEETARRLVEQRAPPYARVISLVLRTQGRKTLLGIGKRRPNCYEAQILPMAIVKITYKLGKERVRISATIERTEIEREQIPTIAQRMIKKIDEGANVYEYVEILDDLKKIGPDVLPVLVQALKEKGNKWPPSTVLCWACSIHKEEALPLLIKLLSDNDGAVVYMAEEILYCLGSEETQELVRTYERLDKTDEVRRERASAAIAQSIRDNSVECLPLGRLIAKLFWLGSITNFLDLGFALARDIGQKLLDFGGFTAMQEAYKRFGEFEWEEELKGRRIPGDVAVLNAAWKGIGGWMP